MISMTKRIRCTVTAFAIASLVLIPGVVHADTSIDGPIDLGTAAPFSVLAGSTVTNTGPSVLAGDLGLSPGTSITGFSPGVVNGTVHNTDEVAALAKDDLTTAYGVAASLTPIATGLDNLTGSSLTPGVYSGEALSVTGALTLAGTAQSVWVFQAASALTIGSGAIITVTGGASACNVFWQVGSSATIGTGAQFVGTVMADESITAETAATITGRLLARTGAVTLDTNTLNAPTGCAATPGTVTTSPEITSAAPPAGQVDVDYAHTITGRGVPAPALAVSGGALPPGLAFDAATGLLSGRPTSTGTYVFDVTVSNGTAPDATVTYTVTVAAAPAPDPVAPAPVAPAPVTPAPVMPAPVTSVPVTPAAVTSTARHALAETGTDVGPQPLIAAILLLMGLSLVGFARVGAGRVVSARSPQV